MRTRFVALLAVPAVVVALMSPATSAGASPVQAAQAAQVSTVSTEVASSSPAARRVKRNKKWRAPRGARFNNPMIEKQRYVIERHVMRAIRNTPKGAKITIAAYSLDRPAMARELIAAYRRGVQVQVLLNDHLIPRAQADIQRVIGWNTKKRNFLKRCVSGCRADKNEYNNLHSKFYLFSKTGRSRNVVMVGSHNMTQNAVKWQWNDLFTIPGNKVLYREFRELFNDMRPDWDKRRRTYEFCSNPDRVCPAGDMERYYNIVFPRHTTPEKDAILDVLNNVQCVYVDAAGKQRRTRLALSMHTMRGNRGNYLADKLRSLYAQGCNLRVNYGLMGFHTKRHLGAPTARGRVPLRSTGFSLKEDSIYTGEPEAIERYTHHKYFALRGSYKGNRYSNIVWTGSTNWASLGTPQDEILFSLHGKKHTKAYFKNFNLMWKKPFSRDAYTTTYASWRSVNGRMVGQDPTVTIEPDGLRPGSTWEND